MKDRVRDRGSSFRGTFLFHPRTGPSNTIFCHLTRARTRTVMFMNFRRKVACVSERKETATEKDTKGPISVATVGRAESERQTSTGSLTISGIGNVAGKSRRHKVRGVSKFIVRKVRKRWIAYNGE